MTLDQTDESAAAEVLSDAAAMESAAADVKPQGIAILGSHPATKRLAPFDKPWLIYACSPDNSPFGHSPEAGAPPRVDVWFEIHKPVFDRTRPYGYLDWLRNVPRVYMRDEVAMRLKADDGHPIFPNAVLYPEDEMKALFNPYAFTSSIAFMMAKAIVDCEASGIRQIGLWGILQASREEYAGQRPGTQYFIWEAMRRGIKVHVARQSGLFEPPPETF